MAQARLLLSRSDIFCRCCLAHINHRWRRDASSSSAFIWNLSYFYQSSTNEASVRLFGTTWLPKKFKSHTETVEETGEGSMSVTSEGDASESSDSEVADFLSVMSSISRKIKQGPPSATSSDAPSVFRFSHELNSALSSLKRSELLRVITVLPAHPEITGHIKKSIVSHFRKSLRYLTVSQLLRVMEMRDKKNLYLDESVYADVMHLLEQRWADIHSGRDAVALLYLASDSSTVFLDRLEDRALDLCDKMTVKEMYRTVYCLARRRRRNGPLLRSLMYCLNRHELDLAPIHLSNLAFALASLNVRDAGVTRKLVEAVRKSVESSASADEETRGVLSSVVQSLGILRWSDKNFMDFTVRQLNRLEAKPSNWARLLHALAWINYLPPQLGKKGLAEITGRISSLSGDHPLLWLDSVWSCCVLDSLTSDLAASVLSTRFLATLLADQGVDAAAYGSKLLAVNAVAENLHGGYSGPLLSKSAVDNLKNALTVGEAKSRLFNSVFEAFSQVAPPDQYFRTNVRMPSGHVIGGSTVDCWYANAAPCYDGEDMFDGGVLKRDGSITLSCRIAVQLLDYAGMTSGGETVEPTGPCVFASRCLTAQGFTVVQRSVMQCVRAAHDAEKYWTDFHQTYTIDAVRGNNGRTGFWSQKVAYNEFDVSLPVAKRVHYLVSKVREAITESGGKSAMASSKSDSVDIELELERLKTGQPMPPASTGPASSTPISSEAKFSGLEKSAGRLPRLNVREMFGGEDSEKPAAERIEVAERVKVLAGKGRGGPGLRRRNKVVAGSSRPVVDRTADLGTGFLHGLLKIDSFLSSEEPDLAADSSSVPVSSVEKPPKRRTRRSKSVEAETGSTLEAVSADTELPKDAMDAGVSGDSSCLTPVSSVEKPSKRGRKKSKSMDVETDSALETGSTVSKTVKDTVDGQEFGDSSAVPLVPSAEKPKKRRTRKSESAEVQTERPLEAGSAVAELPKDTAATAAGETGANSSLRGPGRGTAEPTVSERDIAWSSEDAKSATAASGKISE